MNKKEISNPVSDLIAEQYIPPMVILDRMGSIHYISPKAAQIWEISPGGIMGQGIAFIDSELADRVKEMIQELEQKRTESVSHTWEKPSSSQQEALGLEVKVFNSSPSLLHGEGVPLLYQLTFHPLVNARSKDMRGISVSLAETTYPVFVCSEKEILDCNHAMCSLLGVTREEIVGKDFTTFIHPDDVKFAYSERKRMIKGEITGFRIELRLRKNDSSLGFAEIHTHGSYDLNGKFREALVAVHDITYQKKEGQVFKSLSKHIASAYSHSFFLRLVQSLTDALNVSFAYIGKYIPDEEKLELKALWPHRDQQESETFDLKDSPAEQILKGGAPILYTQGLRKDFPKDEWLGKLQAEGYMGIPLFSSRGNVIGLMVILNKRPIANPELCLSMLQIYSSRVAVELERAENEQALTRNEEKYRMLFESSADGIMIVDWSLGRATECNKRMPELFKTNRQTILEGNTLRFSPEYQSDGLPSLEKMKKIRENANRRQRFEWQFLRPNGEVFDAEVIISPFIHKGQKMSVYILRDITQRKQQEKDLKTSVALQRAMLEALPDLILRLDRNGKVLGYFDPREEREENNRSTDVMQTLKGDMLEDFFPPAIAEKILLNLSDIIDAGRVVSFEYTLVQKSRQLFFEVRLNAIHDHGAVAVVRDLTSVKETQTELADKNKELDVKNRELQKYIESNLQLENFAYIASHDLRQPLLTTYGFAKQMEKRYMDVLDERGKTYLNYILRSSRDMNELIEDLLVYSRVQSEVQESQPIVVGELLAEILMFLHETILAEEATIEVREMPGTISGSKTKLTQLFQNLISNAIKFHQQGVRPKVVIRGRELANGLAVFGRRQWYRNSRN